MKRLCLILAYLFLFTQTASAMPLLVGQKVVYRGTITGLRISAVDGTAFIDNAGATIPTYADGNHSIEIYDSSNRMLKGVLKAAGTGETLSETELIGDPGFNDEGYWDKNTGWSVVGGVAVGTTVPNGNVIFKSGLLTAGARYRVSCDFTRDAGSYAFFVGNLLSTTWNAAATRSYDVTSTSSSAIAALAGYLFTGTADNFSVKQVTAPSSSGATIVSAKGGTTYNFSYKNASFTYNASSYYVIIRAIR